MIHTPKNLENLLLDISKQFDQDVRMSKTEKSTLTHDTRFFYGLGAAPYGIKDNGFSYFLLIFYSQVLGLSPVMTSAALSIAIVLTPLQTPSSAIFRIIGARAGGGVIRSCIWQSCRFA